MHVSVGSILGATLRLVANDVAFALILMAALTLLTVLCDAYAPNAVLLLSIATVVAHFFVLRRLVDRHGLSSSDRLGGFGGFFGVGVLSGLAIFAGALAFILPALFLAARWGIANSVLVAEDSTVSTAMAKSWHGTKGHSLTVMVALLALLLPGLAGVSGVIAIGYFGVPMADSGTIGLDALANAFISVSQVAGWYFEVALYALLVGSPSAVLNEVFA
jgi:hypothetical protein